MRRVGKSVLLDVILQTIEVSRVMGGGGKGHVAGRTGANVKDGKTATRRDTLDMKEVANQLPFRSEPNRIGSFRATIFRMWTNGRVQRKIIIINERRTARKHFSVTKGREYRSPWIRVVCAYLPIGAEKRPALVSRDYGDEKLLKNFQHSRRRSRRLRESRLTRINADLALLYTHTHTGCGLTG